MGREEKEKKFNHRGPVRGGPHLRPRVQSQSPGIQRPGGQNSETEEGFFFSNIKGQLWAHLAPVVFQSEASRWRRSSRCIQRKRRETRSLLPKGRYRFGSSWGTGGRGWGKLEGVGSSERQSIVRVPNWPTAKSLPIGRERTRG